ncbi:Glycosyltransferase involved in cell wall bisynthesis [Lentzea fradiae]|uniref:Glycosyltransferase involved in cell wall bisynthesis n=1 Tax=Lentzea fradiae TaxID=200378 RepID=A0A1G7KPZ2_9PSEU|nr:glycosyltransferase [Lentzea fradiae]SDF38819.1 Glycosyltransferase involved in cell wall bisynthesis [Lentzea fradiae]
MKIAMISLQDNPSTALHDPDARGRRRHVATLSRELHRLGHELTIYTRRTDPRLPEHVRVDDGFEVVHLPAGPARPAPQEEVVPHIGEFAQCLSSRWDTAAPDVVHAHHWISGLAAVLSARGTAIPIVQSFHGLTGGESAEIERLVGRGATGVVATSGQEAAELARLGVRRSRISTVPWGVDTRLFVPTGPTTPRTGRLRVVATGDLTPQDGLDDLIVALTAVSATELVIAGGPDRRLLDRNEEYRRLRALAAAHDVGGEVSFLGHVPHSEMPALLRSADVVACPQRHASFGVVALEAMSCGVPVVATAAGGLAESVVHQVTGLLVPPQNPTLLARALRALLGDEVRRQQFGIAGQDRVRIRYGWDRVALETGRAYHRAAGPEVITTQRGAEPVYARMRRALSGDEGAPDPGVPTG